MDDLRISLKAEFEDEEYRYAYAQSFLNTKLATQIKVLREQRRKTQAEVASLIGIKQPGFSRFEDVNHEVWKTDTLWKIAKALGVRLDVSFKTFSSIISEKNTFDRQHLEQPCFEDDSGFLARQQVQTATHRAVEFQATGTYSPLPGTYGSDLSSSRTNDFVAPIQTNGLGQNLSQIDTNPF